MRNLEERLAYIERQLGRELTVNERRIIYLWYNFSEDDKTDHLIGNEASRFPNS